MMRMCGSVSLALAGAVAAVAQAPGQPPPPEIPVRKLTIQATPAPVPALRYRLLPELRDSTPGNAVLLYYRAFAPEWGHNVRGNKDLQEKFEKALEVPPAEVKALGLEFVRNWAALKEVDRAARRAYCDWEMVPRVREDGIGLLLPDVQSMREYARWLAVRARLELADGHFDRAAHTLQTGLQLGRHLCDAPTLIHALVGAAVTAVMLNQVEEWVRTPGSPNLYWALSGLPQPYIDLRKPLEGERILMDYLLPGFREALADPGRAPPAISLEDVKAKAALTGEGDAASGLAVTFVVAKKYPAAKEYLRSRGRTAEQVEALTALQAVLLYEVAIYDRLFDEVQKWWGQPYSLTLPALERADQALKDELVRAGGPGWSLAGMFLPAISRVQFASARTDRRINMLRCVEAIRIFAAANGRLPAGWANVTEVPVPFDPVTGRPFEYRRTDETTATLTAPPPAGERPYEGNSLRYEITLQR
jgi:hypothetical protein